ncbi:MAG: thioredoxin family protein [Anaerolineae bacterium]
MSAPHVPQVTDSDFDRMVLAEPGAVLLEFYSQTCPHCARMAPIVSRLAGRFAGRVRMYQLNVLGNTLVAGRYGIRGVPTFVLLVDRNEVDRIVGEVSEEALAERIEKAVPAPVG